MSCIWVLLRSLSALVVMGTVSSAWTWSSLTLPWTAARIKSIHCMQVLEPHQRRIASTTTRNQSQQQETGMDHNDIKRFHRSDTQQRWMTVIEDCDKTSTNCCRSRRSAFLTFAWSTSASITASVSFPVLCRAEAIAASSEAAGAATASEIQVWTTLSNNSDLKKLFNEGRALELQGNVAAAQRLYQKVTVTAPQFVYGWSSLGNTQAAFGDLAQAEVSYSRAIGLCQQLEQPQLTTNDVSNNNNSWLGGPKCLDLYVLLLNRGSVRLNTVGRRHDALLDLQQAARLRGRPDAVILQNLARAEEVNGLYEQADRDYGTAIQMTANEVNPFWLRSAMVKYQLGDVSGGYDLLQRVTVRFGPAPEVRASLAVFLAAKGDEFAARSKFLEIPDRQRLKYSSSEYLAETIAWPPRMIEGIGKIARAVGDVPST